MTKIEYLHFNNYPQIFGVILKKSCGISIEDLQNFAKEKLKIEIIIVIIDFSTETWLSTWENCVLCDNTKLKDHLSQSRVKDLPEDGRGVFYSGDKLRTNYRKIPVILIRKDAKPEELYHELFHAHNFTEHKITNTEKIRNNSSKKLDHLELAAIHLADELFAWEKTFMYNNTFQNEIDHMVKTYLENLLDHFKEDLAFLETLTIPRHFGAELDFIFYNFTKPFALLKIKNQSFGIKFPEILDEFKKKYYESDNINDLIERLKKWVNKNWVKPLSVSDKLVKELTKRYSENY